MVAREDHHVLHIGEIEVVGNAVIDLRDTFVPALGIGIDAGGDGAHQTEVHD